MTVTEVHAPVLGEAGEPCRHCGAPLAQDQRYCLECGARRGDARLDHTLYTHDATTTAPAAAPSRPGPSGATIVASVATLLLAMGIGVLIGRAGGNDNGPSKAAAPQVIKVSGGAAAAPAATTPAAAAAPTADKHGAKATKDAGASATKGSSHATNKSLQKLNNHSPKDYQKQSQKLPKTVGTGGKPPPKDNKAPAGGGSFQQIG
jgi:hypothetical protein